MAISIDVPEATEILSMDEFLRRCDSDLDVSDENSIAKIGPSLAALARNREYFSDYFAKYIKRIGDEGASVFDNTPPNSEQTFTIVRRPDYYIRVAAWPIPKDRGDNRQRDSKFYAYNFAHNHGFSLLTVGLLGPGYVSTNYSLTIPPTLLRAGEEVDLRREQDQTLSEGSVLLYRRWHDVHIQNSCSTFSMSLNLMVADRSIPQYSFDVSTNKVQRHVAGFGFEAACADKILQTFSSLA